MFRRAVALALAALLLSQTALAAGVPAPARPDPAPLAVSAGTGPPPTLLAETSGSVRIERGSHENPVMEIAKSVFWGAAAGSVLGLAIMLADGSDSGEPLRWGFVVGAFGGLAAGIYFVSHRPQPGGLLEIRDGRLVPTPVALAALEPVPGGARVRAVAVKF